MICYSFEVLVHVLLYIFTFSELSEPLGSLNALEVYSLHFEDVLIYPNVVSGNNL